ncbi:hypothetical protein FJZ33_07295, partial [Candidatus Poribacteria bacterium]|nr:hypothetical protein [Candidatus Poribacteria bacterium]
ENLITSSGAKIGDDILLTKGIAIEAVSIIGRERKELLISRGYSEQYLARTRNYLKEPGISVLKESMIALNTGGVHAMHDPTEGGLATGLREMAGCSQLGMVIWPEKIQIFPECRDFCKEFQLDPFGIIASGALLIASDPSYSEKIINALAKDNINCAIIGKFIEPDNGLFMENRSEKRPLPVFDVDEITKVFKV